MSADGALRGAIRARLPSQCLRRRPARALILVPALGAALVGNSALRWADLPLPAGVFVAVALGQCYASMMFLAHEVGHGAVVSSRRLRAVLMAPGCAAFLVSPHLWNVWHIAGHHAHTNVPDGDPDSFGTLANLESMSPSYRRLVRTVPGFGYVRTVLVMLAGCFFTFQAQTVLWIKSRFLPGLTGLRRTREAIYSTALAVAWLGFAIGGGWRGVLLVVVVPTLVANGIMLGFVSTNHMLSSLSSQPDILRTTASVRCWRVVDRLNLNFSHHVEHHLFPSAPGSALPEVRRVLLATGTEQFVLLGHARALLALARTPRLYESSTVLIDPVTQRRSATLPASSPSLAGDVEGEGRCRGHIRLDDGDGEHADRHERERATADERGGAQPRR